MKALAAAGGCALALSVGAVAQAADPVDPSRDDRSSCLALTAAGQRVEAVMACSRALETVRSGENRRALVSALVDGPAPPTTTDLAIALQITAAERDRGGALTASAAACDIAERMGDMIMLERCADQLVAIAPSDPATLRAKAALAAASPPWRFWTAWSLLASAVGVTAAQAHVRPRRRGAGPAGAAAAVLCATALASPAARADDPPPVPRHGWLNKWPIDEAHPEQNIPPEKDRDADPLSFGYWLQDVTWKAETYSKRGDHVNAARFYKVLGLAVPDRAIGYLKACDEYEAAGDREQAIEACGQGLLRDGLTVRDYTHFVDLMLGQPGTLGKKQQAALAEVLAHMRDDAAGRGAVDEQECRVGTRTSNIAQLEECTAALQARSPNDAKTISYLWALAVARGDSGAAQELVERARTAGVADADVARMAEATERNTWMRRARWALWVAAAGLLAAAAFVVARTTLARRRLAASA